MYQIQKAVKNNNEKYINILYKKKIPFDNLKNQNTIQPTNSKRKNIFKK